MIEAIRHDLRLDTPNAEGATPRQAYRVAANRPRTGNAAAEASRARAIAMLAPREYPEELEYLREWTMELSGRSGVDMNGLAPLSYETILYWSLLTDQPVEPREVQALLMIDAVMRLPEASRIDE